MKILGRHLLVEFTNCDKGALDNVQLLETAFKDAVAAAGATLVQSVFHRYNPQGVSGVIVIAESHLSIHTWPEYGYAAVDFFTCGDSVDPYRAFDLVKERIQSADAHITEVRRGIPSAADEFIAHKPVNQELLSTPVSR